MEDPRTYALPSHRHPYHHYAGINDGTIRPSYSGGPSSPLGTSRFDAHPPRRSLSTSNRSTMHKDREAWAQTAYTHAWVLDQEIAEMSRQNDETVRWVHEQRKQEQYERDVMWKRTIRPRGLRRFMSSSNAEGDSRRKGDDVLMALRWAREVEKLMEEELLRLEASRLEAERRRLAYEERKAREEVRARLQREQQRTRELRDEKHKSACCAYEDRWTELTSAEHSVFVFGSIPWPLFSRPRSAKDITPERITAFLLSPLHSTTQSRKDRIKSALRRWHPDRFGRMLARVSESDKAEVEEAAGIIARCLNDLLERENPSTDILHCDPRRTCNVITDFRTYMLCGD